MSRRRTVHQIEGGDDSREDVLGDLLNQLCVTLGFCLQADDLASLRTNPPTGVDAFADAVIRAEGLDPVTIDSGLRSQVLDVVEAYAGRIL